MKSNPNNISAEHWLGQLFLYLIYGALTLECLLMALFEKE